MNKIIIFCVLILSLTGCERYEEIDVETTYKPKVVVYSFLGEQSTTLEVGVTRSGPVFGDGQNQDELVPEFIKDAVVTIQQGSNRYLLQYDSNDHIYRYELPEEIRAGEQYELNVLSGSTSMKGNTTIPGMVKTKMQLQFDSVHQLDGHYQYIASITYKVLDPGKHYTQIYPILVYSDSSRDLMYTEDIHSMDEFSGQNQPVTKKFVSTLSFTDIPLYPVYIEVMVVNADEGFAKNNNRLVNLFGGAVLTPFIEPAVTYKNMSGPGIGSFGSFNSATRYYLNLK